MVKSIVIPGEPIAKQRHRTANGLTYNPQSEIEAAVKWQIKKEIGSVDPTKEPLFIGINAHFPRPKNHYGTGRNAGVLKPSAPKHHTNKPDHDNIYKFYLDAMNKIVFNDDTQVIGFLHSGKFWTDKDDPGRVEITIVNVE